MADYAEGDEQLQDAFEEGNGDAAHDEELASMRARLAQLEDEKKKMEEHTAKAEKEFQGEPEQPIDAEEAERVSKEADSRSVYVGNVDYDCTPEELQRHFQECGVVNRVTILTDKFGGAKGYAYIEFEKADAALSAVLLDGTSLRAREIKVNPKRHNVPGMKERGRGRGRGPPRGRGFFPRGRGRGAFYGGFDPSYGYGGYGGGYGYAPRGRGRGRNYYAPY